MRPILQTYGNITVVRDDLYPGGSKARFLPGLIEDAREIVYGGPAQGGAAVALAFICKRLGKKATLFYAERKTHHRRQRQALAYGATIVPVPMGFIANVQAKARAYCEKTGALLLTLGFDVPAAEAPYLEVMADVRRQIGDPEEIWCATASGMLTNCLGKAFPNSEVRGVAVGLASRWKHRSFPSNVKIQPSRYKDLSAPSSVRAPFPICPHYEAKVWEVCKATSRRALFWNVIGA